MSEHPWKTLFEFFIMFLGVVMSTAATIFTIAFFLIFSEHPKTHISFQLFFFFLSGAYTLMGIGLFLRPSFKRQEQEIKELRKELRATEVRLDERINLRAYKT